MKAAVWYGRQDTRLVDVPEPPAPGPGEVKIKVAWVGVCGTDLHEYAAGPIFMPIEPHPLTGKCAPLTQGHEFSGIIQQVGPGVNHFKPGDRITADSATWCGKCWACQRREYSLCDKAAFLGRARWRVCQIRDDAGRWRLSHPFFAVSGESIFLRTDGGSYPCLA